eukprot:Rmarinus@m.5839
MRDSAKVRDEYRSWFPLHDACLDGNAKKISALLESGYDVNAIDWRGRTPLHHACGVGLSRMCSLLLSKGARTNIADDDGKLPGEVANDWGQCDLIKILETHDRAQKALYSALPTKKRTRNDGHAPSNAGVSSDEDSRSIRESRPASGATTNDASAATKKVRSEEGKATSASPPPPSKKRRSLDGSRHTSPDTSQKGRESDNVDTESSGSGPHPVPKACEGREAVQGSAMEVDVTTTCTLAERGGLACDKGAEMVLQSATAVFPGQSSRSEHGQLDEPTHFIHAKGNHEPRANEDGPSALEVAKTATTSPTKKDRSEVTGEAVESEEGEKQSSLPDSVAGAGVRGQGVRGKVTSWASRGG